jgi:para-nitrobenzyl esterase
MYKSVALCLLGLLPFAAQPAPVATDRVRTTLGLLEGAGPDSGGVRVFRGIPYAAPPVAALRWRPPQPLKKWTGIRATSSFAPRCMQQPIFGDIIFRSKEMSEDCLYLNVWTPARSSHERLPVLVYFHGGGFVAGDGSEPRYDGASMARHDVVMVTLNYRLGVFGFLAHPGLSDEVTWHGSGNYGLLDQVAALRWVHDNIAAFGGDPARVTLGGESAGSVSVSALMASPLSRRLIVGAIGESGSILGALPAVALAQAQATGVKFANTLGVSSVEALRALPAEQLLEGAGKFGVFAFDRTVDHYLFPKSPTALYAAGEQAHVPLLAGSNSEEMSSSAVLGPEPATVAGYGRAVERLYGAQADAVLQAYRASTDGDPVLDAAQALASDRFIAHSTWRWTDAATRTGSKPTFYYYYSRRRPPPPPARGAVHAAEIEYALGNLALSLAYAWTPGDYGLSQVMQSYLVSFIRTGNPNAPGLPSWPRYAGGQRMRLDSVSGAEPDTAAARGQLLDRLTTAAADPP